MAEYIEREKLLYAFRIWQSTLIKSYGLDDDYVRCLNSVLYGVENTPAADARPVVRGKWRERRFSEDAYGAECSVCHTTWDAPTNFCPNCGADMRECKT